VNVLELQRRTLERLGDDPDLDPSLMHYTPQEVLAVLNQVQRLFCLFTLCLETTANFGLTGQTSYHLLDTFPDWIAPLRIRNALGAKMRPSRLADLEALDRSWRTRAGTPVRYNVAGFDLLSVYMSNTSTVPITYARSAAQLVSTYPADNGQIPEIPERAHPALIEAAIPILRVKEGMSEWQKTVAGWNRFLDVVEDVAGLVRARNRELGYDALPVELKRMDRSRMLQKAG
jgi:hypothetical protein